MIFFSCCLVEHSWAVDTCGYWQFVHLAGVVSLLHSVVGCCPVHHAHTATLLEHLFFCVAIFKTSFTLHGSLIE